MSDWLWRYIPRMSFWGRGRPSPALLDAEQRCYNIQPSLGQWQQPRWDCPAQWDHQAPTRLISRETFAGAAWPGRTLRLRCWLRLVYSTTSRYSSSSRAKERFQCSLMRFLVCQYGGEGVVFFMGSNQEQTRKVTSQFCLETERSVSSHINYKNSNTTAESALVVHDHSVSQVAGGRVGGQRGNSLDLSWTAAESRFWSPHQSSCRSGGDPLRPTRNRPWSVNQTALKGSSTKKFSIA